MARALMFQGTGSDVGKSTLVAGLGRALVRRGLRVRPFKPQNMSNNAAVTADGGEIGRAQALQAQACRVPSSVHMNPVLLKPETARRAQLIVQGQRAGVLEARDFLTQRAPLLPKVMESFAHVSAGADLVLVEGAGSASEVNLRARDIANWGFAQAAQIPVILVGDIDRGGVIASLVGTKAVLAPEDAALVRGFVINKFRGEASLFAEGIEAIARHTGWPCHGVLPWLAACGVLPAEDGVILERRRPPHGEGHGDRSHSLARCVITVLTFPSIANFDDLDPLAAEPDVQLRYLAPGEALPADTRVVILPGSKATRADLAFLRAQGWDIDLLAHVRRGGFVVGLCGGYQMLGREVRDPTGQEASGEESTAGSTSGSAGSTRGLGLLEITTTLEGTKTLAHVEGRHVPSGAPIAGYEIHLGRTEGPDTARPVARLQSGQAPVGQRNVVTRTDGAISADGRIWGSYVHGLFASDQLRRACLATWGAEADETLAFEPRVEAALDALADAVEAHLDVAALLAIAGQ